VAIEHRLSGTFFKKIMHDEAKKMPRHLGLRMFETNTTDRKSGHRKIGKAISANVTTEVPPIPFAHWQSVE